MHIEAISLIAIGALVLVVGVSILSGRIGIASPLILVVLGIGTGYIPGVPLFQPDPEIILLAVLPPLLYSAAVNVPVLDLRRNIGPIAGLSVVLVIVSALLIGLLLHLIIPSLPLAAGVALGAVVAPTDAVAATSIGKRLGLPPRLVTILEGESLVNDATSLVLLRTALAAVAGSFVFWEAAGSFVYAVAVAVLIGLAAGAVTVWIRSKLDNPVYDTVISFAVPFVAFTPTEYLGASGVLAVVVTGLYSGHHAARRFSATARVNERLNWRTVQFLLENGVFLLMGLELHALIEDVGHSDLPLWTTGALALGVAAVLILLRLAFMVPMIWTLRRSLPRYEARADGMRRLVERVEAAPGGGEPRTETQSLRLRRVRRLASRSAADLQHEREQGLDWKGGAILGWSGMRGVVTLAAAQSIPVSVPYRSHLVLVAFLVAALTLLLHGLTLPALIRALRPSGPNHDDRKQELMSLYQDLVEEGNAALDGALEQERAARQPDREGLSERLEQRVRASVRDSLAQLAFSLPKPAAGTGTGTGSKAAHEATAYLRLAHVVLDAQRAALLEERAIGQYSSQVLRAAAEALDAYELRLTPPRAH